MEKVCKIENIDVGVNQRGKKIKKAFKAKWGLTTPNAKAMEKDVDTYKDERDEDKHSACLAKN